MNNIYTTLGNDVKCKKIFEYESLEELQFILPMIQNKKYIQIGGGSNILFRKDYDGYVLHSKIKTIDILDNNITKIGSGVKVNDYVDFCIIHNLHNICLTQIYGIPAEIGGIVVNNAAMGFKGIEPILDHIDCINLESGELKTFDVSECEYSYRKSRFKDIHNNKWCILYAYFKHDNKKLNRKDFDIVLENRMRNFLPVEKGKSLGCIWNCIMVDNHNKPINGILPYLNTDEIKELKVNDAMVFKKFPCIIENTNKCSGEDVYQLSQQIKNIVEIKHNIKLNYEIEII